MLTERATVGLCPPVAIERFNASWQVRALAVLAYGAPLATAKPLAILVSFVVDFALSHEVAFAKRASSDETL